MGITLTAELWRATAQNVWQDDLSAHVVAGRVDYDARRDGGTPMAASFTLRTAGLVAPWQDCLAPVLTVTGDDGTSTRTQVGLFVVMPPAETRTAITEEVSVEGRDLTYFLAAARFTDTKTFAAGTQYGTAIRALLSDAGLTRQAIPGATYLGQTMSRTISFPVGASRLEAVNKLLRGIGYWNLAADLTGTLVSRRRNRFAGSEAERTYSEADLIEELTTEQPDADRFANVVVARRTDTTKAPLTSVAREDDPANPLSTVALGREVVKVVDVAEAEDQSVLDDTAASELEAALAYDKVVRLRTLPDPDQGLWRLVDLSLDGNPSGLNGRYRVLGWSVGFTPEDAATEIVMHGIEAFA